MYINYESKVFATFQSTDFEFKNISISEALDNVYLSVATNKPRSGKMIWASTFVNDPELRNYTHWTAWLEDEMPEWLNNKKLFSFKLKPNANILIIDEDVIINHFEKLLPYLVKNDIFYPEYTIDFKKISYNYDGMFVSENVVNHTYTIKGVNLCFNWDVETLLVWNMSIICPWDKERIGYYPLQQSAHKKTPCLNKSDSTHLIKTSQSSLKAVSLSGLCIAPPQILPLGLNDVVDVTTQAARSRSIDYDSRDAKFYYIYFKLVYDLKIKRKITKREKELIYNLLDRGCLVETAIYLILNKIQVAKELGMEELPYCSDERYDKKTRVLVALSQATMYLYNYFK